MTALKDPLHVEADKSHVAVSHLHHLHHLSAWSNY
jgi:hypothetical protein